MVINPSNEWNTDFGLNCYFPMPFARGARITVENEGPHRIGGVFGAFWFHVDYECWQEMPEPAAGRFHAQWRARTPRSCRRKLPSATHRTRPTPTRPARATMSFWKRKGTGIWSAAPARGQHRRRLVRRGRRHDLHRRRDWPPTLHGTGTEDCVRRRCVPESAILLAVCRFSSRGQSQLQPVTAMYRWHLERPGAVPAAPTGHDRARPREQLRERLHQRGILVPGRTARAVPHAAAGGQRLPRFPEDFARTLDEAPAVARALHGRRAELGEQRFAQLDALCRGLDLALRDNRFAAATGIWKNYTKSLSAARRCDGGRAAHRSGMTR